MHLSKCWKANPINLFLLFEIVNLGRADIVYFEPLINAAQEFISQAETFEAFVLAKPWQDNPSFRL
jgi:hypothetical protein